MRLLLNGLKTEANNIRGGIQMIAVVVAAVFGRFDTEWTVSVARKEREMIQWCDNNWNKMRDFTSFSWFLFCCIFLSCSLFFVSLKKKNGELQPL